jgi:hypothetical protein
MTDTEFQPIYTAQHALIIGINNYRALRPLYQAERDANEIATILASEPYNFAVETLFGEQATYENIDTQLRALYNTKPDDAILIYFAGHGITDTDRENKSTGYLAAVNTEPEVFRTAISLVEVTKLRKHAKAKHILFIFDACFSGHVLEFGRGVDTAKDKFLGRRAYQAIAAGASDQVVADINSMSREVVKILKNPYLVAKYGLVTANMLGTHLKNSISDDENRTQIPYGQRKVYLLTCGAN